MDERHGELASSSRLTRRRATLATVAVLLSALGTTAFSDLADARRRNGKGKGRNKKRSRNGNRSSANSTGQGGPGGAGGAGGNVIIECPFDPIC
jgi:hypothetical protein